MYKIKKYSLIIVLLIISCTTEPEINDDDNTILHSILSLGEFEQINCLDLPDSVCVWNNGRITILNLHNFNLKGSIPNSIGNLTELKILGLKANKLTGNIPANIGNLTQLIQLNLSDNLLEGSIPNSLGLLKNIMRFDLSNNNLSGQIPSSLSSLNGIISLNISSNNLEGTMHPEFCDIEDLDISNNQLCESIPNCIDQPNLLGYQNCNCTIQEKSINGYCYSLNDLSVLDTIINRSNNINILLDSDSSGIVESLELGKQVWQSNRLKVLDCFSDSSSCNLSSEIHNNIGSLDSLSYLDFHNNLISGHFPESIKSLANLKYIDISNNELIGTMSNDFCLIDSLILKIDNNSLCPCYPKCINEIGTQDTSNCNSCNEDYQLICDDIPETINLLEDSSLCFQASHITVLQSFIDTSLSKYPDSLDLNLDFNNDGTINPLELGNQFWENGSLVYLDASKVGLSGSIPDDIANLDSLYILKLDNNFLSGSIPDSICNIKALNWDYDQGAPSDIQNNKLCPPYPDCIAPFISNQDTTYCD